MLRFVEHERHLGGARVVGILNQFEQNSRSIGVEFENIVYPACEGLVLTKRLDILQTKLQRVCVSRHEPPAQGGWPQLPQHCMLEAGL